MFTASILRRLKKNQIFAKTIDLLSNTLTYLSNCHKFQVQFKYLQVFFSKNDYDLAFEFHVNKNSKIMYPKINKIPLKNLLVSLLIQRFQYFVTCTTFVYILPCFHPRTKSYILDFKKLIKKLCNNDMFVYLQAFMAITFHFILLLFTNIDFNFQITLEKTFSYAILFIVTCLCLEAKTWQIQLHDYVWSLVIDVKLWHSAKIGN